MDQVIRDASGHILGRTVSLNGGDVIIYLSRENRTVARYTNGVTLDENNRLVGRGDLGMMVLGEYNAR